MRSRENEIGHQAAPHRHRIVDDDDARCVGHELGKAAGDAEADREEQGGDDDVQPVLAGWDREAAALRLQQDQQRDRADAVADQPHRPRRDLVERDAHRGPAQPPAEAQRHQQELGGGGSVMVDLTITYELQSDIRRRSAHRGKRAAVRARRTDRCRACVPTAPIRSRPRRRCRPAASSAQRAARARIIAATVSSEGTGGKPSVYFSRWPSRSRTGPRQTDKSSHGAPSRAIRAASACAEDVSRPHAIGMNDVHGSR